MNAKKEEDAKELTELIETFKFYKKIKPWFRVSFATLLVLFLQAQYLFFGGINRLNRLEEKAIEHEINQKVFMKCFMDLNVNPYKYIPVSKSPMKKEEETKFIAKLQ